MVVLQVRCAIGCVEWCRNDCVVELVVEASEKSCRVFISPTALRLSDRLAGLLP